METQLHQNCSSSIGFRMSVLIYHKWYETNNLFIYVHFEMSKGRKPDDILRLTKIV